MKKVLRYKKIYRLIGLILVIYALAQFIGGMSGFPIMPETNIILFLMGTPIVTIGILIIGLLLLFEKEKNKIASVEK